MNTEKSRSTILSNLGIESLNEMQIAADIAIKNNSDIVLLSPTGSGKTLAFLLPIFDSLVSDSNAVQCLIIVPSRELALQIEKVWKEMRTGFKANTCYGGHAIEVEIKNLSNPPAVLIGTPGRLTDHLERKTFDTDGIKTLILDEFDKSLQLGFLEEMNTILSQLPNINKRVLISATSDVEIPDFIQLKSPAIVDYTNRDEEEALLEIKKVVSPEKDKIDTLFQLICSLNSEPAIIFCNHREVAERISGLLTDKGILTRFYHGGMDQDDRERVLIQFRNGSLNYLITTDLAARGLDIPEMKHVIHYHLPSKESEFVHRNGRTARMKASGTAYILTFREDSMPDYIDESTGILNFKKSQSLPNRPDFTTIYISGGKKNKLNKSDIVGFFIQKGKLDKSDLGLIEVKDFVSFVAVRSLAIKNLLDNIKDEKMKGKKYKIEITNNILKKRDEK